MYSTATRVVPTVPIVLFPLSLTLAWRDCAWDDEDADDRRLEQPRTRPDLRNAFQRTERMSAKNNQPHIIQLIVFALFCATPEQRTAP